ncbi:ligand-binding sensor domain-containing protein [Pseudoxanthomonas helianthi]
MRLNWRAWLALACMAWLAAPARAGLPETPRVRQLTVADGLPSNAVWDVAEDADGYLWLATGDGLARYDGIDFKVWRIGQGLSANVVQSIAIDRGNRVLAGTLGQGLAIFDAERKGFRYLNRRTQPALDGDSVWTVTSTANGDIWFGVEKAGLYRLAANGRLDHYLPRAGDPRSLPSTMVTSLHVAPDGTLWIGTDRGVARWTGRDFARVPDAALVHPYVTRLYADRSNALWIGTIMGGSLYRADGGYLREPWVVEGGMVIYGTLLQDRQGTYWLDAFEGLYRAEEDVVWHVPLYSAVIQGTTKPQFTDAMEDAEGGLWFSSSDSGLWYLTPDWRQFSVLTKRADKPDSLGNPQVYQLAPSRSGAIWAVGTSGTLDEIDPETGAVVHRVENIGPGTIASSVFEDRDGLVWVGTPGGVTRYDPATRAQRRWRAGDARDAALSDDVTYIAQDAAGLIWTANLRGDLQARRPDDSGVVEQLPLGDARGVGPGEQLHFLGAGPGSAVWLADSRGVRAWNARERRFTGVPGLPEEAVTAFAFDENGDVWLAGLGYVEQYRRAGAQWRLQRRLDAKQGMPQIEFSGVVVDRRGVLWLSSARGLLRLDPASRSLRLYGVRDGLPGQEIIAPPILRPQDGRIIASAAHGLVIFDPLALRPSREPPRLNVESIGVQSADGPRLLPVRGGFHLAPGDRDLRVVAHLESFKNAASHRYRFRLSGVDADWAEVGASGERIYTQLPPGNYRLEIVGATADNVWSKPQVLQFVVDPAWWQTWWARGAAIALVVLSLFLAAASYRRRLRRRNAWQLTVHKRELAEQASLAKTRFLATLGHEVRTPMTGVLGMSELLLATPLDERQRGYTTAIQSAGKHLLRLVNDALDLARIEAGKLDLDEQAFDPRALFAELTALCEPIARQRGLSFAATVDAGVPAALRGDPLRVRQILLNLLNNALKFTEQGGVSLHARPRDGGVRFSVDDTGPGISVAQQERLFQRFEQAEGARTRARYGGSGLGLAICQELALAMGGRIAVESAPGAGTRFHVDLPLPPAAPVLADAPVVSPVPHRELDLLLVEDDPTVAEVIAGLLRARGHRVQHVAHGLAALAEVAVQRFDLAVLDLDLPGLDGLALARQLRAQGFAAPLLAVTARADGEAEPLAREAGFDGFLRKPVTGDMLAEAIGALLDPQS